MEKVTDKLQENNVQDIKPQADLDKKTTACIMLAIDTESTFKLYSYRCITPEQLITRIEYLVNQYKKA